MEQKINYHQELEKKIKEIQETYHRLPTLLLHSCCGPCSSYCLSFLMEYFDITVYYFNPNIFPEQEYVHRLSEQTRLISELNKLDEISFGDGQSSVRRAPIKLLNSVYDHDAYLNYVQGFESEPEGGARCKKCFELRLKDTAQKALEGKFDFYATTLSVSPHKNAVLLNETGFAVEPDGGPKYLISDFKKKNGYKISIELSKRFDLYRQNYCGCEFAML